MGDHQLGIEHYISGITVGDNTAVVKQNRFRA